MSPAHKELVFDFSDMRLISIECNQCSTEVTLDASNSGKRVNSGVPTDCPACGTIFDSVSVQSPIAGYLDLYKAFGKITHKVRLKVRIIEKAETR